ncbi:MAG TPA: OsmC family protein [Terriglobia bacterium]|nr:OsmC family protein [Terriglobia bacterium]
MVGTFGGALEARKIDASDGNLTADVRGEVETEEGVLVIKRVHVAFTLRASDDVRETVERVHGFFANKCPVYRSLYTAIQITSSYTLVQGSTNSRV